MRTDEWADAAAAMARRPASGWRRRHVSRATASALRLPADPPDTKHPPALSGNPASERSQSSTTFSAATAAPASCQLSPENDQAPTRASNSAAVVAGAAGM